MWSKIGLKCSVLVTKTFEPGGVALWNFAAVRAARWEDNAGATFGGNRPLKIWEGKKRPKFSTFYDNFWVWPQISLERIKISTSGKKRYQVLLIARSIKKLVNFGPLILEITRLMFTHLRSTVRVLRMLNHLSAGQVTLLSEEFYLPFEFSPNRT